MAMKRWFDYVISRDPNRFKRVKKLGRGTFGEVWQAIDGDNNKNVALKQILGSKHKKQEFPDCAVREIEILGSLSHPNIISMHGLLLEGSETEEEVLNKYTGNLYIVMELADNTLGQVVRSWSPQKPPSERKIAEYMTQLLEGIDYLHARSIIHRDIKVGNILVKDDTIKIADFGLSRKARPGNMTRGVGTLCYCAPEVLNMDDYGYAADIWSCGCVFGELLSGKGVFQDSRTLKLMQSIVRWKTKDGASHRRSLDCSWIAFDLLDWMLELDPKKRPTARQALSCKFLSQSRKRKRSLRN